MMHTDPSVPAVFIMGTGTLARAIVEALSILRPYEAPMLTQGLHVYIYSRDLKDSCWLATVANVRSNASGSGTHFHARKVDWDNAQALVDDLNILRPGMVINIASLQSVTGLDPNRKWTNLVRAAGYGVTLPLQYRVAGKVGAACAAADAPPLFINACYPDGVNYVLKKCGHQVFCGIGNIGIIDLVLSQILSREGPREDGNRAFRMLATHYHVIELTKKPVERIEMPRLWFGQHEYEEPGELFDQTRLSNNMSLNAITALTCTRLIHTIIRQQDGVLHLPGPDGLLGGYPVTFRQGALSMIGTGMLDQEAELQWNRRTLEMEGLSYGERSISFSAKAFEMISEYSGELAKGFAFTDIESFIDEFLVLRQKMNT